VRVLLSLWHWACWWSSVVPDGVRLAVPLSHERLARLVGATRPTVTSAISRLRRAGYLAQRADGLWLLLDAPNGAATAGDGRLALDSARLAATRHAAQLVRLKERAEKLRATAEVSGLARQAREWRDGSRSDPGQAV
jgi:DNA-binding transcriptional ArsR family regulator